MSGENLERFKKYYLNEGKNELIEKMFLNMDESSSSEHIESKMKNRRGLSLDRSGFILDNSGQYYKKPQWFEVPKKERKERSKLRRESNSEFIEQENVRYSRSRQKNIQRQNASEFRQSTSDSMTPDEQNPYHHHQSEEALNTKFHKSNDKQPKEMSKFQIGKRFLKGEIGIKSFNYYLIKEGLKSSKKTVTKQGQELSPKILGTSKSEENIYEEIYFTDKPTPEHHKKQFHKNIIYPDCELCVQQCSSDNCDICKYNTIDNSCLDYKSGSLKFTKTDENIKIINSRQGDYGIVNKLNKQPNVLQFQSYNPNNPGVYKIETTPVAFTSDYNPIQNINQQIQFQPYTVNSFNPYTVNRKKSSSSSDSLHQKNTRRVQSEYFACPPKTAIYPNQPPDYIKPKIYKTDSRASLASEISIKSENSVKYHKTGDMSDSSIGDSMFSYPTQRRYFGSSESCRFGFECRRCSLETDKCSFSDTCRYECKNCDCSSSYFSSDFDDTNFNRKNSTNHTTRLDARTTRYAEDFIKHVNNVKKNTLYHINKSYEEFPTTHKNLKHQKLENSTKSPLKLNQDEKTLEENENLKLFSTENKETLLNRKKNKRTGTVPKSIVNDKLFIVKQELENVEGNSTGKINFIEQTELDVKVNCNLSENKILKITNKLSEKKKISDWSDDEVFFDDLVLDAVAVKKVVSFLAFFKIIF